RAQDRLSDLRHSNLIIGENLYQRRLDFIYRFARHDAAVDRRARNLRQGVVRMPALQHGGDTSSAQLRVVDRFAYSRTSDREAGAGRPDKTDLMSAATWSPSSSAVRSKYARVVSFSLNGKLNFDRRARPSARR